jgi:hypothetical protein
MAVVCVATPILLILNQRKVFRIHMTESTDFKFDLASILTHFASSSSPLMDDNENSDFELTPLELSFFNVSSKVNLSSLTKPKGIVSQLKENNITTQLRPALVSTLCMGTSLCCPSSLFFPLFYCHFLFV